MEGCLTKRLTIHVMNSLPKNPHDLVVHCASKDDDLGFRRLGPNVEFKFSFCTNVFGRTLFFCHLWWGKKEKAFDAYKEGLATCGDTKNCYYVAKSDGVYVSTTSPNTAVKLYGWDIRK